MKKRRKNSRCLNCQGPLEKKDNYCSNCGQENTDHQVSLSLLLREITSNFFSLDSRFAHTFKPFLFNPGKITNAFIEGKRVYYANPIRWYLVISIFHFFFMSKMFEPTVKDMQERSMFGADVELSATEFDSLYNLPDTTDSWPFSNAQRKVVNHLIGNTTLDDNEIYDTLKLDRGWINEFATIQSIRTSRETTASVNNYLLRQIPIIIFFILPIFAFVLKVFFWRKGLYIRHLIHSIHLHSFFFFLLGWVWILSIPIEDFEDYGIPIASMLSAIYIIFSFKRVYGIKLVWGFFRLIIIGIIYMFIITASLLVGVFISLLLF